MKKILVLCLILIMSFFLAENAYSDENKQKDLIISNKLFYITLPNKVKDSIYIKKKNNGIFIYDRECHKAGFGGFAFGIQAYKNPADHAMMPGKIKIGELEDKKNIYDIVLIQPTEIQYDYTKKYVPKMYKELYNYGLNVPIEGKRGKQYLKNSGMRGKDLYREAIKKHIVAIKEKWDSNKLEQEDMSYMYNVIAQSEKNVLDKVGYVFYDVNTDGIDELLIGEIAKGDWKGVVYDIYTMVNRKPVHVVSGGARNRYYACDYSFVCNEYSSGADESGMLVYNLTENSTELFFQVGFKYDGYENPKNPWFITYDSPLENNWENVSKKKYDERKSVFNKYVRFDFVPLSRFK